MSHIGTSTLGVYWAMTVIIGLYAKRGDRDGS